MSADLPAAEAGEVPSAPAFRVVSHLEARHREALDQLLFFNPRQARMRQQVLRAAAEYGPPEVVQGGTGITLGLRTVPAAQTLFVLEGNARGRLQGVLLYVRERDRLVVLYLALVPALTRNWQTSCAVLVFITRTLREIASRIAGVRSVDLRVGGNALGTRPI